MQAQLILADRLVSLGTVAAGVAHEINNPLSYVLGNLEFVDAQLQEVTALCATCSDANHPARPKLEDRLSQAQEALADVRTGAERVQRIVRDLKVFSLAEADQREKVELHDLLDIAVTMTGNEIRHRARLLRRYGEVPPVFANGGRLTQLFINLLVNAAQAIPDGDADRNEIAISTWTEAGDAVVEVSDTGCGIPKEHLSRIFDPFFTTKPTGVGSGLGLSICHGIAVGLGGGMEVQSAPGAGTRMQVRLPGARREALPGPGAAPPRLTAESRRRVLVVDDDPLCVRALQRVLAERDEICPCTSARAALQRLLDGERFDVILCDVMMPDMGGADFYEAVCAQVPEQAGRIVLMTGGAFSAGAQAFLAEGRAPCLEKPFSTPALLAVIDRLSR